MGEQLLSESHDDARTEVEAVLDIGGGVGELGAEIAGADGTDGEATAEADVETAAHINCKRVGA